MPIRPENKKLYPKNWKQIRKDIFAEAKGAGFDVKIMRAVIKLRKMNAADRDEQEFLIDTYRKALNI